MNFISQQFNSIQPDGIRDGTGNGFFAGWEMYVQKDLRQVLGQRVRGRFSRTYCGGGSLARCRSLLDSTLLQAADQLDQQYGSSTSSWQLPVTCPATTPPSCDQIVPTAAGAIDVPPQPFDNRGTFYQADAIVGHRPVPATVPTTPGHPQSSGHRGSRPHRRRRSRRAAFTG